MSEEIFIRMSESDFQSEKYFMTGDVHRVPICSVEKGDGRVAITQGNTYSVHTDFYASDFEFDHVVSKFICYECAVMLFNGHTRGRVNDHNCRPNCVCYNFYKPFLWDLQCLSGNGYCSLNILQSKNPLLSDFENIYFTKEGQLCLSVTTYGTTEQTWPLYFRQPDDISKRYVMGYLYYTRLRDRVPYRWKFPIKTLKKTRNICSGIYEGGCTFIICSNEHCSFDCHGLV